ncbi:multidrug DMT transporter [Hydrogenophaga crassostreae]|uniref:Multidrug DMT transporter n=1 Tax=Hydrogenophaga crassostreae TaxID=1763535 RepID=A0A162P2V0_9BURK|nr:DMT family transporter [Hydrogenophaga crassostreae]AOW12708.1 multidrug DMT transporter [Hydrogenophaga crassostreae]OAD40580.1 multidrug DMT transporter [Hydrogenophaga crassostreae]
MSHPNPSLFARPAALFLLATFCCLLWGSAYPSIKYGYAMFGIARHDVASQMVFAGVRFVAAGGLLLLAGAVMGWGLRIQRQDWASVAVLGLTQTALQYIFFYIGVANASGSKSSIMNATGTFFSVLLAHFIYHNDRLSGRRMLGCLVGFVGVAAANYGPTLLQPDFTLAGEGSIVLAAFVLSAATIYGKKLSQRLNPAVMTGWQMAIGGSVLLAGGWLFGGRMEAFTPASTALMTYMALLSALAFSIWSNLLKHNPVGRVTIFNFLIPIFGVALSAIFLGEDVFEWKYGVALLLVCAGIWLVTAEKRPVQSSPAVPQPACV